VRQRRSGGPGIIISAYRDRECCYSNATRARQHHGAHHSTSAPPLRLAIVMGSVGLLASRCLRTLAHRVLRQRIARRPLRGMCADNASAPIAQWRRSDWRMKKNRQW